MNIRFLVTGKTTGDFLKESLSDYSKRIGHYASFSIEEIVIKNASAEKSQVLLKEAEKQLGLIKNTDYLVLLDETGEHFTSVQFAARLEQLMLKGMSNVVFIIGGAYGFHESLYQRANLKMALSKMTFTHQMVRLIFTEQLYRAFTIIRNEKYHH